MRPGWQRLLRIRAFMGLTLRIPPEYLRPPARPRLLFFFYVAQVSTLGTPSHVPLLLCSPGFNPWEHRPTFLFFYVAQVSTPGKTGPRFPPPSYAQGFNPGNTGPAFSLFFQGVPLSNTLIHRGAPKNAARQ